MKVLFTAWSLSRKYGGIYNTMRLLGRALGEAGVSMAAAGVEDEFSEPDRASWHPMVPQFCPPMGPRSLGYAPNLLAKLDAMAPDVVHAHGLWTLTSRTSLRYCRSQRRPYVVSPHGMMDPWALRQSRWKKRLAWGFYEKAHLSGASCLHALCTAELEAIRAAGLSNPVCVIPVGVELPTGEPGPAPWIGKIPAGEKILFSFGRLHPKKGLKELVTGWTSGGRPQGQGWHLVIAGWDQIGHEPELRALIAGRPDANRIHFLGALSEADKIAAFAHCDAFVLPSFSEGLPMVVLEAWAQAKPALITPRCNLDLGYERGAAIRIEPDPVSIAAGLQKLFALPDAERRAMGERGRTLIKERFLWPKVAADFRSVYAWISGAAGKPACVVEP